MRSLRKDLLAAENAAMRRTYRATPDQADEALMTAIARRPALAAIFDDESVSDRDLARRRVFKDAVRDARKALYYQLRSYRRGDDEPTAVNEIDLADPAAVRTEALRLLAGHASTAERMDDYPDLLRIIAEAAPDPIEDLTVVDVGCGIHPLALLAFDAVRPARYVALDRDQRAIAVLQHFEPAYLPTLLDARVVDASSEELPRPEHPSMGIMLKYLTVAERTTAGAASTALELDVDRLVVTGNVESLAKRQRIAERERRQLRRLIDDSGREVIDTFDLPSEIGFVLGPRPTRV